MATSGNGNGYSTSSGYSVSKKLLEDAAEVKRKNKAEDATTAPVTPQNTKMDNKG